MGYLSLSLAAAISEPSNIHAVRAFRHTNLPKITKNYLVVRLIFNSFFVKIHNYHLQLHLYFHASAKVKEQKFVKSLAVSMVRKSSSSLPMLQTGQTQHFQRLQKLRGK